jgi:hypothetical protein
MGRIDVVAGGGGAPTFDTDAALTAAETAAAAAIAAAPAVAAGDIIELLWLPAAIPMPCIADPPPPPEVPEAALFLWCKAWFWWCWS